MRPRDRSRNGSRNGPRRTPRALVFALASGALAALAVPSPVTAQAICSAPHSSPTLTQSGAIRTLPAGAGWIQVSALGQRATEWFNTSGTRQSFAGDSRFDTRSVYVTAAAALATGVELWAQVPFHRLSVEGSGGSSRTLGVGDVRTALRVSPAVVGLEWPVAVRAGVKVPGSEFPVDATQLPLTEGQSDLEVSVETGWSSLDYPVYVVGWVGYRWRGEDVDTEYKPGDERFAHLAVGGTVGTLAWELGVDALWGLSPREQRLTLDASRRRLLQLLPTVGSDVGPGRLELTVPIPLSGRNLPAGYGVSLGYRTVWGM